VQKKIDGNPKNIHRRFNKESRPEPVATAIHVAVSQSNRSCKFSRDGAFGGMFNGNAQS